MYGFHPLQRELDTLTLTGSTINDLELKLTRTKQLYQRTLEEYRQRLEATRLRLNTHIVKSEPFVDVWRRARQVVGGASCMCIPQCRLPAYSVTIACSFLIFE